MLPEIPNQLSGYKSSNKLEDLLFRYKFQIIYILIGAILIGFGAFIIKNDTNDSSNKVEILEDTTESKNDELVVEVAGAVESPGVYKLSGGARVEDLLIAAGGLSADADRNWMEKSLNRASKISDGQKIYIPRVDEQTNVLSANNEGVYQTVSSNFGGQGSGLVNINSATQKELESLWGIGPVYAQNIIEHRPYSSVEELLSKKIIKQNVYDTNKDKMTVY
jgi:competence protein ComEA